MFRQVQGNISNHRRGNERGGREEGEKKDVLLASHPLLINLSVVLAELNVLFPKMMKRQSLIDFKRNGVSERAALLL